MNTEEKFVVLWAKQRAIGLIRWTLVNGMMAFGSSCALLAIILFTAFALRQGPVFRGIIALAIAFPLAGIGFGVVIFLWNEARYRSLRAPDPKPDAG